MMKLLLLAILIAGCTTENVRVSVNCATSNDSVECTVQQVEGKSEVEACWDFTVTCANGAVVKAPNMCQKVGNGGTQKATASGDKLIGLDKCGGEGKPRAELSNLTINGKPSTL